MNKLETKHVIAQLARRFIVGGGEDGPKTILNTSKELERIRSLRDGLYAMYFRISIDVENYGYERDGSSKHKDWERRFLRTVHVMVTQRHNVFVCDTPQRVDAKLSDWENSSNHDSCWHDDGLQILDQVAWDGYERCFGFLPCEHRPIPLAAHSFVQFADWYFGRQPFEIVKLKGECSKDNDYRWSLTEMKKVEYQLNIIDPEFTEK